jgi:uncharacterized membrane protein
MSKPIGWLLSEIDRWTAENIITAEQAARLRARYPAPAPSRPWGLIVFFGIGAVVIGLGVILLFAYNWDAIPKVGKLAIVFAAVAAAHGSGLALRSSTDWRAMLGEALTLFGTMAFGAGIWLVAQIYNINEHFPNGFLIWGLGALAMAWALGSIGQALLATVTLTIWGATEVFSYGAPAEWAAPLLIVGIAPLVWRLRSAVLLAALLAALYLLLPANAEYWAGGAGAFLAALTGSVGLIAGARLVEATRKPAGLPSVMRFFGVTGFLICAFILTFADAAKEVLHTEIAIGRENLLALGLYRWVLLAAAVGAWSWLASRALRRGDRTVRLEEWIFPAALLLAHVVAVTDPRHSSGFVALMFNLVVLGIATMWIVRGCQDGRLRAVVLGSLLLGAVVFARYFDLFDSLAARGLAFIVFGGVLFAEGFYYRRLRQQDAFGKEVA